MIYKNIDIHGAAEIIENGDGSVTWLRLPQSVIDGLDKPSSADRAKLSTGVEIRFVIRSGESATITMSRNASGRSYGLFHVFRGGVQGGYIDHENDKITDTEKHGYVIERSKNLERLKIIAKENKSSFSPEVVRIVFDRGRVNIHSVEGDVTPPERSMLPEKTLLAYGSSITHGSNSLNASYDWTSLIAHRLDTDLINLGMAGSCLMEPSIAEYIAELGETGKWQIGLFELGINALGWDEEMMRERSESFLRTVCERNPEKPIIVVSPFFAGSELFSEDKKPALWRRVLSEVTSSLPYKNIRYIPGDEILDSVAYLSGDEIHPSVYGVLRIAEKLGDRIERMLKDYK